MLKFLFKKESLIKGLDKANFYINRGKEFIIREKMYAVLMSDGTNIHRIGG